jgi:type IV pilus assembly protein PilN
MIRINLLPYRAVRKKENVRRQVSIFSLSLLLVLVVLVWIHFFLGSKQKILKTNVEDTKKELASYKEKDQRIRELQEKLADLEKRTQVIKDLEENRHEPVYIMDNLTQKVVESRMWLTRLAIKDQQMDLAGVAMDNKTVADFMDNLQAITKPKQVASPLFPEIDLKQVQVEKVQNSNLKSFQIIAKKTVAPPPAPEKKK